MVAVKVCGVTSVSDALACVKLGADAIGLNFYAGSPRCVPVDVAAAIVSAVGTAVVTVGVFVDAPYEEIARVQASTALRCVQLHGDEPPALLERFLPHAYKAIRMRGRASLDLVASYPGRFVLLDAYVPGAQGGTGATFDWRLAAEVARTRQVTLAGGLTPDNVAAAVAAVQPFCVDVASGVESAPGVKDPAKVAAFVAAAKGLQTSPS
ncbi:MAG TPA: phosphoribosylanthranilate isomerase [Polyangiales bacterium]|jgi:phosphoribosylanthranilate isomerase